MAVKHTLPDSRSPVRSLKRPKTSERPENLTEESVVLLTASEIKSLLSFKQDSGPHAQDDVRKVHSFLSQAQYIAEYGLRDRILRPFAEFLEEMTPSEVGTTSPALSEVVKTWNFASQFDETGLFTSTTALLALMLKTMSTELSLRRYGTAICQTVVMDDQVKLLEKGLAVGKGKGQLIIACLSLITEVVSFDGGICCRAVLRRKATLFSRLDEFLTFKSKTTDTQKLKQVRGIRHQAIALLLANIRVQESSAKAEMFCDPKMSRALFHFINQDSASDVLSVLRTLKNHFFADSSVSRSVKSRVLSESSLTKIAALYNFTEENEEIELSNNNQAREVIDTVHEFLLEICSSAGHGAVLAQDGWYASEYNNEEESDVLSRGLFVQQFHASWPSFEDRVPVKNTKLAYFIQDLQPHRNIKHRELVLSVFRTAPELIADFFLRKKSFSFDPKLTSTWIGYAGFLLEVAKLEPPDFRISRGLPSPTVVLENILPSSTSSKIFNKCLASTQTLIKFIAAKTVTMSLRKLRKVFEMAKSSQDSQLTGWHEYITRGVQDRCPDLNTILSALKGCGEEQRQLKEVLLQLVSQYHLLLPSLSHGRRFDLSIPMADILLSAHGGKIDLLDIVNLDHLSDIALSSSPDFDWFRKPDRIPYSPFTAVFRLCVATMDESLCFLICALIKEHFVLQSKTAHSAVDWLITSLQPFSNSDITFTFLDNCFLRLSQRPVKYEGDRQRLMNLVDQDLILSNLAIVVQEQWLYFTKANSETCVAKVASWLATWLRGFPQVGENRNALRLIQLNLKRHSHHKSIRDSLKNYFETDGSNDPVCSGSDNKTFGKIFEPTGEKRSTLQETTRLLNVSMKLSTRREDFPQLLSWLHKTIVDAVEEGDIAALIRCLSIGDQSVRKQATVQIRKLASKVEASAYSEKQQLYLLLMEVIETASQHDSHDALPAFTTAFASRCVTVLHDPTNLMYRKINRFLIRAPTWDPSHLPSYWKDKIFAKSPTKDDDYECEAEWLLEVFIEGLQTAKDFNSYRRHQIFEAVLVRADNMPDAFMLRTIQLLWRCSFIDGCSTTLLARCGIASWMDARLNDVRIEALKDRIMATCDQERVTSWGLEV